MQKNKKLTVCLVFLCIVVILSVVIYDAFFSARSIEKTDYAMGAVITQTIEGKKAEETANEIIDEINKTENEISWRIEDSFVYKLNEKKSCDVSDETLKILTDVIDFSKNSFGVVDPTVGSLTRLWNIGTDEFKVPDEKEIEKALSLVDFKNIKIRKQNVTIGDGQTLDLGFVGKGVACDKAKTVLKNNKIKYAVINAGGSLCLHGENVFSVGIRNPLGEVSQYMAVFKTKEAFVSTSGNYERFSEDNNKKYHHILSTETGYPVDNNLLSVTVVCDSGLLSDALSTASYCLGYEKSLELLKLYNAEAVFIFDDKTVKVTDGLKDNFEIKNDEFIWKEN